MLLLIALGAHVEKQQHNALKKKNAFFSLEYTDQPEHHLLLPNVVLVPLLLPRPFQPWMPLEPEAVQLYLPPRRQQQILLVLQGARWGLHGSHLFIQQVPQMLWIKIWDFGGRYN